MIAEKYNSIGKTLRRNVFSYENNEQLIGGVLTRKLRKQKAFASTILVRHRIKYMVEEALLIDMYQVEYIDYF